MTRPNKYGNRKAKIDGYTFASQAEGQRYRDLRLLLRGNLITRLRIHPPFKLWGRGGTVVCTYKADFAYIELDAEGHYVRDVVEDVKGVRTPLYRLKRKLFRDNYGFDITEIAA